MAGPITVVGPDGQQYEFPAGTSREVMREAMGKRYASQPRRPLSERWSAAKADPAQRRSLLNEIGESFSDIQFSDEEGGKGGRGFAALKSALDMAGFGIGRRTIRNRARKAFPGMTKDEASMVADIIEKRQFERRPVSTVAGGLAGLGVGAVGGGSALSAAGRAPGAFGAAARAVNIAPPPGPTGQVASRSAIGNVGRGATGGAIGAQTAAQVADERDATPLELGVSSAVGGALPAVMSGIGYMARPSRSVQEAERRVGQEVGIEGAERADAFRAATGQDIPVGGAALDPSSGYSVRPLLSTAEESATPVQRAIEMTDESLMGGMEDVTRRAMGNIDPMSSAQFERAAKRVADEFMSEAEASGASVRIANDPDVNVALLQDMYAAAATEPNERVRAMMLNALDSGNVPIRLMDGIRQHMAKSAGRSAARSLAREGVERLTNIMERNVPGYNASVVGGMSRRLDAAASARAGARSMDMQIPADYAESLADPRMIPEAVTAGAGSELIRRFGESAPIARAAAQTVTDPGPAARLEAAIPQGRQISEAGEQWVRASEGVRALSPQPRPASIGEGTGRLQEVVMGGMGSLYFAVRSAARALDGVGLPDSVKREVTDLLTDPTRVDDAIAAMRRAGAPDDAIGRVVTQYRAGMAAPYGGAVQQGVSETEGARLSDEEYRDRFIGQLMDPLSRALFESRGGSRPNTTAELDDLEDRLFEKINRGVPPERAVDDLIREIQNKR